MTPPWEKRTFIIAEAGVNHNGDLDTAKELVRAAARADADAVKFQAYKTERLLRNVPEFSEWHRNLKSWEFGRREFSELKKLSDAQGIAFLASFFDRESLEMVRELGLDIIKVPSGELTNHLLLEDIAALEKDVILSTGLATMEETNEAVAILKRSGNLAVLHCVAAYPARLEDYNLRALESLKSLGLTIGISDHTQGNYAAVAAVAMGARVVEKHFTLDRGMEGPDHAASAEPAEMKDLVDTIRKVEKGLGTGTKGPQDSELETKRKGRKGLVAARDIVKGEVLRKGMLTAMRPEEGISPRFYKSVVGKTAAKDLRKGEVLYWEVLK